jgi:F-type H+-transporting ATPase subunit b
VLELNYTLFIQLVSFLVFIALMNWVLVKPALKILNDRRVKVEGTEEDAAQLVAKSEDIIVEYDTILSEAKAEASKERERLKSEGIEKENGILMTVREESKKLTDQLKIEIGKESKEALNEMKQHSDILSKEIAEKILGRKL